jgi:hypothetical protein
MATIKSKWLLRDAIYDQEVLIVSGVGGGEAA